MLAVLVAFVGAAIFFPYQLTVHAIDTSTDTFLSNSSYDSLIADQDFININSMNLNDIQSFLVKNNSYLAQYSEGGRTAAQIIYDAAHGTDPSGAAQGSAHGITLDSSTGTVSPEVILVTLQKEQSLITLTKADHDLDPTAYGNRLQVAMGYGCPDSASCDPKYAGFTNQVGWGAWQLRYSYEIATQHKDKSWWDATYPYYTCYYFVGNSCSFSDSSGVYNVTFADGATASLYSYTPHVFYGNYNFWKLFNTWFTPSSAPVPVATPAPTNDTSTVAAFTYDSSYKIQGTKDPNDTVYFNGKQIAGSGSSTWSLTFTPDVTGATSKTYPIEYHDSSGNVVATKNINVERHKLGDINGDGKIDILDLSLLGQSFDKGVPDGDWRNLNPQVDNNVNILDLSILANNWTGS